MQAYCSPLSVGLRRVYTINQWPKFLACLESGTREPDTNLVENMIRPTKLGMKKEDRRQTHFDATFVDGATIGPASRA